MRAQRLLEGVACALLILLAAIVVVQVTRLVPVLEATR